MLTLIKRLTKTTLFLGSVLVLQGCVTAAVVGTAAVATKVATDPRTTGRQIDDETLEERIAYRLNQDAQLKEEARINVVSYNGRVLLIGQAPSEMAKETAKNVTMGIEGVSEVYNEIRIGGKIGFGQITKDSWITTQIKSKLLVNAEVKTTEVKVISENGEAFLMGNLTRNQADAAAEVARNVSGVTKVIKVIQYIQ